MKYKISEIGKVVGGGTPSTKHAEYYSKNGIAWITPKDLSDYHKKYIGHGAKDISEEGLKNSSAKLLPVDSILVSSRAPIGYVAMAGTDLATSQGFKSIVPNTSKVMPEYLYYLMLKSKDKIEQIASGSTFKEISGKGMSNFTVDIPELKEQKEIVQKLNPIFKKIEENNRINDNLTELKTTIFNKMFSINLTNCLNGKIKDIAEVRTGKRPKIKYSKKGSTPIYPIIGASKIMGYTDEYLYNKSIITTGRVGTLGVVKRYREPVWVSDNSFIFITKYEDYLYELLTHFINYSALNIGSTQPLITQTEFKNVDIYIPKREELIEFKEKVVTLTEQQFELRQQNRLLNDLKSYLLSKLF